MTDETKQDKHGESANDQQPAIMINTQYIKDLSLEIPLAPEIFREITSAPKIDIHVDVDARHMHDNFFNVDLILKMDGDLNGKKLFILELTYSAIVALNVPQEHLEPVLLIEIPRMIFPFARNVVTTCLVEGGLPPFMINPIDFMAMYNRRKQTGENAKKE